MVGQAFGPQHWGHRVVDSMGPATCLSEEPLKIPEKPRMMGAILKQLRRMKGSCHSLLCLGPRDCVGPLCHQAHFTLTNLRPGPVLSLPQPPVQTLSLLGLHYHL